MKLSKKTLMVLMILSLVLLFYLAGAQARDVAESSYHGQLGKSLSLGGWGNGLGMLEKWDAFNNFSFKNRERLRDLMNHPAASLSRDFRKAPTKYRELSS